MVIMRIFFITPKKPNRKDLGYDMDAIQRWRRKPTCSVRRPKIRGMALSINRSPSAGWSHVIFDAIDRCADKSEPKNLPDVWNELLLPIGIFGIDCKQMLEGAAAD